MLKVLVPVDGSDNALHAVEHVIRLAKENTPVAPHLISVYYEPVRYGDVGQRATRKQLEEYEKQAAPALERAEALLRDAGIRYEREVAGGEVPDTIARRAEELGCDAIVMGTRGAGALENLVIGSTANKVVHLTRLPVTLVK